MFVDLSYSELLAIASALKVVDSVYGASDDVVDLIDKVDDAINVMDTYPIIKVYPGIEDLIMSEGVGTINT